MIKLPEHIQDMIWEATGIVQDHRKPDEAHNIYYFFQIHQMERFIQLIEAHYAPKKPAKTRKPRTKKTTT